MLSSFLTLCQEECPLTTGIFQQLQASVRTAGLAGKVAFVEVTVDPGRDTPARLRAYRTRFGVDWTLLTGTASRIRAFWKPLGVYYQNVPEGHPASARLVDRQATDIRRGPLGRVLSHRQVGRRALRHSRHPVFAR